MEKICSVKIKRIPVAVRSEVIVTLHGENTEMIVYVYSGNLLVIRIN